MSKSKTRMPEFGRRGREKVEPTAQTAMQRLRKMGSRWLRASGLKMKKEPQVKGFKRTRLQP